jgi:DNA-binding XRE family transcriptional regulator
MHSSDRAIEGELYGMENGGSRTIQKNRVRELRENRLMTQAQLARKARVALRTIHSVEKGMNCRMDTKRKILLALGKRFEDKDQVFPPVRREDSGFPPMY